MYTTKISDWMHRFCITLLIHQVNTYNSNSRYYKFQVTSSVTSSDWNMYVMYQ